MKNHSRPYPAGTALIIAVLAVLTAAAFAVLSLTSALGDLGLSEKTAQAARQYYALEAQACGIIARALEERLPGEGMRLDGTLAADDGRLFEYGAVISPEGGVTIERWSFGGALPADGQFD